MREVLRLAGLNAVWNDPLETWEVWLYPLLIVGVLALRSQPTTLHWAALGTLEVLVLSGAGLLEMLVGFRKRPVVTRSVLIALSATLALTLFQGGDQRVMYWITLGLCLYGYGLTLGLDLFLRFMTWVRRVK
ncbi:MAG: hypothetical protein HC933_00095 [Pleurocapsa sp. SU_196_0]|nr:hypothetical protein [Pleurocapsa sp. SU_196_0]